MAPKTDFTAHRLSGIKSNLGSWILSLIVRENRNRNVWHTGISSVTESGQEQEFYSLFRHQLFDACLPPPPAPLLLSKFSGAFYFVFLYILYEFYDFSSF